MNRPAISAVIITKDEEENIERCLSALNWLEEIIVIDSGSADKTVELAKKFTPRVFFRRWEGYGRQKNFAISLANSEWVLSIDSDEVVSRALKEEIIKTLSTSHTCSGFYIPRKNFIGSRFIRFGGWYPDYTLRLFKKGAGKFEDRLVHEKVSITGKAGYLKTPLLHYTYRGLKDYSARQVYYSRLAGEQILKENKKVSAISLIFRTFYNFFKSYILRLGFLDGCLGFHLSIHSSRYVFRKYKWGGRLFS